MELLIELIVWIFKTVFGDPEKTVDTKKLNRRPPLNPDRRGPYSYGDESGSRSNAPKTLEEILEEARRQAGQRRDGMRPANRQMPPPVQPTQPVQPRRLVEIDAPATSSDPASRAAHTSVGTTLDRPEAERPSDTIEWASRVPTKEKPKPRRAAEVVEQSSATIAPLAPLGPQRPVPQATEPVRARNAPRAPAVYAVPDLLQAIRTAPPADKRDAARQAMVMYELFGPPRSRRPHRPGMRSI